MYEVFQPLKPLLLKQMILLLRSTTANSMLFLLLCFFQFPVPVLAQTESLPVQSGTTPNSQSLSKSRKTASSQTRSNLEIMTFARLQSLIQPNADTVRVINFWATSCRPCIEEMPDFDRLHREYSIAKNEAKPLQVVFVSLDFKRDVEPIVIPFVKKRGFAARCVFLGAPKSAEIDAVDTSWTGSMPATLIIGTKPGQRMFYERKLRYEELKDFVKTYLFP